jgi:hypothetical protein
MKCLAELYANEAVQLALRMNSIVLQANVSLIMKSLEACMVQMIQLQPIVILDQESSVLIHKLVNVPGLTRRSYLTPKQLFRMVNLQMLLLVKPNAKRTGRLVLLSSMEQLISAARLIH